MNQIVLDTDVWSFLFKRDSRAELYRAHLERNTLYISFQTVAELYQWAETNNWGEGRWAQLNEQGSVRAGLLSRCIRKPGTREQGIVHLPPGPLVG